MFSEKKLKVDVEIVSKGSHLWSDTEVQTYLMFNNGKLNGISGQSWIDPTTYITFEDFKIDVNIKKVYSEVGPSATIKIYGVSKQHMDIMTRIAMLTTFSKPNKVRVSADDGKGYSTLFEGSINTAVPVYSSVPNFYIEIESSMAAFENNIPSPPRSYSSGVAISTVCKEVCADYRMACEVASNVTAVIDKNERIDQQGLGRRLGYLAKTYGILPVRTSSGYRIFNKETGNSYVWKFTPSNYSGYPTFTKEFLVINTFELYGIEISDKIKINGSEQTYANGTWVVNKIEYRLQSRIPKGKWEALLYLTPYKEKQ